MPKGRDKGFAFEREICKRLSKWWSIGVEHYPDGRDDIFWRSAASGGRATNRGNKGQSTAGSHGDIAATDPIGAPLTKLFAIELKRGKSHGEPGDLLDCTGDTKCHKWIATMEQTLLSAKHGKTLSWLIIVRRDRRKEVVFIPSQMLLRGAPLYHARKRLTKPPCFSYRLKLPSFGRVQFIGVSLKRFLACVKPSELVGFVG
jgi:hypothetical protein